jgi:hypothetical protein
MPSKSKNQNELGHVRSSYAAIGGAISTLFNAVKLEEKEPFIIAQQIRLMTRQFARSVVLSA